MVRRRKSKIDGVYDVTTRDGAILRVKPFATTEKRIQNSQKKIVREAMKKTIFDEAGASTMSEFVKNIIDGKIGSEIYKNCKKLYPVKRIEIYKSEVVSQPTIMIKDEKPKKEETAEETEVKKEKKPKKEKKTEEVKEPETKEEKPEEPTPEEEKPEEKAPKAKKTAKKATKAPAKKKAATKKKTKKKEE
jgi:hypothetical protein